MIKRSENILWTAEEIASYIGVSKNRIDELVKAGMPVQKFGGAYCAYKINIENFFQQRTNAPLKNKK